MKAWVLYGINNLYLKKNVSTPKVKNGETLVHVKTSGICSSDIARVYSTGSYHYPIILGHEFSGTTKDGRRVGVFPLIPCFECDSCKSGTYETCSNYSYIGSRQDGGFAEYVAVPDWNLFELPNDVSFEESAVLEPAAVALHAVKQLEIANVNSVVVVGNGVIGKLIAKWLKIYGIDKVNLIGKNDTPVKADAYFEAVGNIDALKCCIENVCPNGQIVLVGNPNAEFNLERNMYWKILREQLIIRGSWNSSYPQDWQEVLKHVKKLNLLELISHKYAFGELDKALSMMKNKSEPYCKVVVNTNA